MNQNPSQPNFELPTPVTPGDAVAAPGEQQVTARPEQFMQPTPAAPVQAQPFMQPAPAVPFQPPQTVPPVQAPGSAAAPVIADDTELIEKEWVIKAKQIVAATKDDPYKQNREMSRFRADYLKKRYNKDLKIDES